MSYHTFCSFLANLAILAQNDPLWFYLENEYQAKRFAVFKFLYETKKIEVGRPKISIYVPPLLLRPLRLKNVQTISDPLTLFNKTPVYYLPKSALLPKMAFS